MAQPSKPRVRAPSSAKAGEMIEIKTLISHDMESGQRKGSDGAVVPRRIIKEFTASFDGTPFFRAEWQPAISANPYQSFFMRAVKSGTLQFAWLDDDGSIIKAESALTVA